MIPNNPKVAPNINLLQKKMERGMETQKVSPLPKKVSCGGIGFNAIFNDRALGMIGFPSLCPKGAEDTNQASQTGSNDKQGKGTT